VKKLKIIVKLFLKPFGYVLIRLVLIGKLLKIPVPVRLLVMSHLMRSGSPGHPNKEVFTTVLQSFDGGPLTILETGTSAWGADSTRLWDLYVQYAGGKVTSVDIRRDPAIYLQGKLSRNTHLMVGDSVEFLRNLEEAFESADLIYLDSFDVDWAQPEPAEIHGEKEFEIAMKLVRIGGVILIDDTPTAAAALRAGIQLEVSTETGAPIIKGKGARAIQRLRSDTNFEVFFHDYAVAIKRLK
jgi:hypothetical protein